MHLTAAEKAIMAVIVLLMLLMLRGTYEAIQRLRVERHCLAAGWPHGNFRWIGPSYCIKRVDQTDVVKSLADVEAGR